MGVPVQYCGERYGANTMLEYRLANRFNNLSLRFSQANTSPASDQQLTVALIANGSQLDIQTVPFNEVRPLTYSIAGVNALQIQLWLNDEVQRCGVGDGVVAVLEELVVS